MRRAGGYHHRVEKENDARRESPPRVEPTASDSISIMWNEKIKTHHFGGVGHERLNGHPPALVVAYPAHQTRGVLICVVGRFKRDEGVVACPSSLLLAPSLSQKSSVVWW